MTPSPSNTATPATVPATPTEVMAALQRMHKKTDALLTLLNRLPQP